MEPANNRGPARGLGEHGEKDIYFRGRGEQRPSFEGNKDNSGEQGTLEKYERGQRSGIDTIKYHT